MKKGIAILLVLVLFAAVGGLLFIHHMETLPETALKQIAQDVKENGITAIEPYLTDHAVEVYQLAKTIVQSPLSRVLAGSDKVSALYSILRAGASDLSLNLEKIERGEDSAEISLNAETAAFSGKINLSMVYRENQWLIRNVSLPLDSWIIQTAMNRVTK